MHHFYIIEIGEGGWGNGLNFAFELSKMVDWYQHCCLLRQEKLLLHILSPLMCMNGHLWKINGRLTCEELGSASHPSGFIPWSQVTCWNNVLSTVICCQNKPQGPISVQKLKLVFPKQRSTKVGFLFWDRSIALYFVWKYVSSGYVGHLGNSTTLPIHSDLAIC